MNIEGLGKNIITGKRNCLLCLFPRSWNADGMNVRMEIDCDPMLRHHTCKEAACCPVFLVPGIVYITKNK
jgi:hypothetical protein